MAVQASPVLPASGVVPVLDMPAPEPLKSGQLDCAVITRLRHGVLVHLNQAWGLELDMFKGLLTLFRTAGQVTDQGISETGIQS